MVKVSIIIPVYNSEKYLSRCIESIIAQSYKNIEIICVNSGSKDKSLDILRYYCSTDNRIIIINKENEGVSCARNAGLNSAKGEYIYFVDSDDYIQNNAIEKAVSYSDKDIDLVIFKANIISPTQNTEDTRDKACCKLLYNGKVKFNDKKIFNTNVHLWNKMYKNSIIKQNNILFPNGLHYEDAAFFYKYTAFCKYACYTSDTLYNYCITKNSIMDRTYQKDKIAIDHLHIIKNLHDFFSEKKMLNHKSELLENLFIKYFELAYTYSPNDNKSDVLEAASLYAKELFSQSKKPIIINLNKKKYKKALVPHLNTVQKIFSIKNLYGYKFITILCLTFKLKKHG